MIPSNNLSSSEGLLRHLHMHYANDRNLIVLANPPDTRRHMRDTCVSPSNQKLVSSQWRVPVTHCKRLLCCGGGVAPLFALYSTCILLEARNHPTQVSTKNQKKTKQKTKKNRNKKTKKKESENKIQKTERMISNKVEKIK